MIPWKRQQIWFWLAAILIVVSASALRDTTHQTVDNNRDLKKPRNSTSIIRNRSDLPPVTQETSVAESTLPIQRVAFEQQVEPKSDSELEELVAEQNEIVHADHSELQVDHEESPTQVVQISLEQSEPDQANLPAVWLSGTIEAVEPVEDFPRIQPRR